MLFVDLESFLCIAGNGITGNNSVFSGSFLLYYELPGDLTRENQKGGMMFSRIKTPYYSVPVSFLIAFFVFTALADLPAGYAGLPFRNQIQSIPGVIYTWRYDSGGAEITWHTSDHNQGDCHLRRTGTIEDLISLKYLNTGWDHMSPGAGDDSMIHYTDTANNIYIGWVVTDEWQKMTVNVKQAGTYQFDAMVTACCDPASTTECIIPCDPRIRIDFLNGSDSVSTGIVTFTKTGYYHHYMYEANLGRVTLKQGVQLHKTYIVGYPPFNLWYFKYTLISTPAMERQRHFGSIDEIRTERVERLGSGTVAVSFRTAATAPVRIDCYDSQGRLLVSQRVSNVSAGLNRCLISENVMPGMQVVRLSQGNYSTVSKMVVGGR